MVTEVHVEGFENLSAFIADDDLPPQNLLGVFVYLPACLLACLVQNSEPTIIGTNHPLICSMNFYIFK